MNPTPTPPVKQEPKGITAKDARELSSLKHELMPDEIYRGIKMMAEAGWNFWSTSLDQKKVSPETVASLDADGYEVVQSNNNFRVNW